MRSVVVADAGPLIAIARLHQLELLPQLFERVLVTEYVFNECTGRTDFSESKIIQDAALNQLLSKCKTPTSHFELPLDVDAGEAGAIAAAIELNCGVFMDDKAGRRMAKNLGCQMAPNIFHQAAHIFTSGISKKIITYNDLLFIFSVA